MKIIFMLRIYKKKLLFKTENQSYVKQCLAITLSLVALRFPPKEELMTSPKNNQWVVPVNVTRGRW